MVAWIRPEEPLPNGTWPRTAHEGRILPPLAGRAQHEPGHVGRIHGPGAGHG